MSFDFKLENGDMSVGSGGDIAIVEKSDKLVQDVLKIISTPLGSNKFFPWYGSPISQSLVGTAFDSNFVAALATQQLQTTLETLQKMQDIQARDASQFVSAQEHISAVQNVIVRRNSIDPRFFTVQITVLSKAFRRVQTNLEISL